jgi:penicillin-binding protein 2
MSRDWRNQFPSRRGLFLIGGGIAFAGLTARLAELQIFRAEEFDTKATENRIRLEPAPAHRGTIYDRTGRTLAGSKRNFYVVIRPEMLPADLKIEDVLDELGKVIPRLSEQKKRSIKQEAEQRAAFSDITVADDLTWEEFAAVNVLAPELGCVSAKVGELRSYPLQGAFYHTIGYVAKANDKDTMAIIESEMAKTGESPESPEGKARIAAIRRLYKHPQMRVGKIGLEAYGESQLRGEAGKQRVLVNASGRVIEYRNSDDVAGKPGAETVLSLDAELQNFAKERFGNEAGSAIVIDVATGEVMCMISTPTPDPNLFVSGIANGPYQELRADERNPLYHKAYDGIYPPGSTFKIVVAAAAIENGAMTPEDKVHCSGRAWYYSRYYHCHKPEGHGWVNLRSGMAQSCDCYFYEAARRTGIEKIAEMAKKFGLGHIYQLGLTGGRLGAVPNDEWKRSNPRIKEKWYDGDTISAGIGQGYVETSPFQLAVMTARVAGGHATPDPKLVISGIPVPDQAIRPLGEISEKTLALVRDGMVAVTSGGTATRYGSLDEKNELPAPYTGARMAGKSGSAQVRVIKMEERDSKGKAIANDKLEWRMRDHALFVAYAPIDKPRYACAIVVDHGGSGSGAAAPIAKDILAHCLKFDPGAKKPFQPQRQEVAAAEKAKST